MSPSVRLDFVRIVMSILSALALSDALLQPSLASDATIAKSEGNAARRIARINGHARVDCITPDGRFVTVSSGDDRNPEPGVAASDNEILSCPLQEGETIFIISFSKTPPLDCFTFINENAEVRGEMKIAVSNDRLPADSPKWTDVSGKTEFTSKRLFNFSLVGVEARYVKLSFRVGKEARLASLGL